MHTDDPLMTMSASSPSQQQRRLSNSLNGSLLGRGFLGSHKEIAEMVQDPMMGELQAGGPHRGGGRNQLRKKKLLGPIIPGSGRQTSAGGASSGNGSPVRQRGGSDSLGGAAEAERSPSSEQLEQLEARPSTELMGPLDPEGIHNYLLPGMYDMVMSDPSRLLIFYTFAPDSEKVGSQD